MKKAIIISTFLGIIIVFFNTQIAFAQSLPRSINLNVPFQAQAPFGNWALPYSEACEDASIIMVDHYLRKVGLSKQQMKSEIDQMVAWEKKHGGWTPNMSVERVVQVAKAFYNYKLEIISNLTINKIKTELALGHPVIVPTAGRKLGNLNFRPPGPLYHMIVIKGYTASGYFITNDPGTHKGADYLYGQTRLINAVHDWTGTSPTGPKIGLIMYQ